MYITTICIWVPVPPTRLRIRTVITPCTQGHFARTLHASCGPSPVKKLACTRGGTPEEGMCCPLLNICVIQSLRGFRRHDPGRLYRPTVSTADLGAWRR